MVGVVTGSVVGVRTETVVGVEAGAVALTGAVAGTMGRGRARICGRVATVAVVGVSGRGCVRGKDWSSDRVQIGVVLGTEAVIREG